MDECRLYSRSDEYLDEVARLALLHDYLTQFWESVAESMGTVRGLDELVVGKTRVVVVESSAQRIVLRILGQNRRYTLADMPPKLAVTLAGRVLSKDARNQVFFAAFHLADNSGDREEAGRLLTG